MGVSYNIAGVDDLPAISVPGDPLLLDGVMETHPERPQSLTLRQAYPGHGFVQSVAFGVTTCKVRWIGFVVCASPENAEVFLSKIEIYVRAGGRYLLIDEIGKQRSYVELRGVQGTRVIPIASSVGGQLRYRMDIEVLFEDMQPA